MFCSCPNNYQNQEPNTFVCPVCLALPGSLPVVNRTAMESAIKLGLALNCEIAQITKFDRKNYSYPDLMKGYQISQYDQPIAFNGFMNIADKKEIRINRVHMEEDVAKLIHHAIPNEDSTLMDVNRAGVPLLEVVSEPDIRTTDETESYISKLQSIVQYLEIGSASMEEGSFRCDANISIKPKDSNILNERVEIKNMNRIKAVTRAIDFETKRQIQVTKSGNRVIQETRGWDDEKGISISQRSKEDAHDYRYFPEPDIPTFELEVGWIESIKNDLPELPSEKIKRFCNYYGLSEYDSKLLASSLTISKYFEIVVESYNNFPKNQLHEFCKETANWLNGEILRLMNSNQIKNINDLEIPPNNLKELIEMFQKREISNSIAKEVLLEMFTTKKNAEEIVNEKGLKKIQDVKGLSNIASDVIKNNPEAVQDYLSGKETVVKFLVGQMMKISRGKADPKVSESLIKDKLKSLQR
jgi:aspartyl-tRNA(Asn)/glutamyl-tRNA(Gln) amidotransferase subunit B